jgi:hypothetical protein
MWGRRNEKEDEERSKLLLRAREGDLEAEHELMMKYGLRVYSDAERSKMPTYYDSGKKGSAPSQGKAKAKAETKNRAKTTAKGKGKKI